MSRLVHSRFLAGTGKILEGVSTTGLGNLSYRYDQAAEVTKRRRLFARDVGTSTDHGVMFRPLDRDVIVDVDETFRGLGMGGTLPLRADAVVTTAPGVGLFLLLGDCQGVTLYDPRHHLVALAHCGRKSTDLRLIEKLVIYLQRYYESQPEELLAYMGPSIGVEHYVFESEVRDQLTGWGGYVRPAEEKRLSLNLRGYNLEQLRLAGLRPKHIEDSAVDTYSSPDFYSHAQAAREGVPEGRFAQYVELPV